MLTSSHSRFSSYSCWVRRTRPRFIRSRMRRWPSSNSYCLRRNLLQLALLPLDLLAAALQVEQDFLGLLDFQIEVVDRDAFPFLRDQFVVVLEVVVFDLAHGLYRGGSKGENFPPCVTYYGILITVPILSGLPAGRVSVLACLIFTIPSVTWPG